MFKIDAVRHTCGGSLYVRYAQVRVQAKVMVGVEEARVIAVVELVEPVELLEPVQSLDGEVSIALDGYDVVLTIEASAILQKDLSHDLP